MEINKFPLINQDLFGYNEIYQNIKKYLDEFRFNIDQFSNISLKTAIIGPNKSGKSNILSIFINELFIELITTGLWKKIMIFFLNQSELLILSNNNIQLFNYIVNITFKHLEWYRPDLIPIISILQKSFLYIINSNATPILSKSLSQYQSLIQYIPKLQLLINDLFNSFKDSFEFTKWFKKCLNFPKEFLKIFGYNQFIFICDNFESFDSSISPSFQFSNSKDQISLLNEIFNIINNNNFIISTKNQKKLFNFIKTNFNYKINYFSTLNIILDSNYNNYHHLIYFQNEKNFFYLNSNYFLGNPYYLNF